MNSEVMEELMVIKREREKVGGGDDQKGPQVLLTYLFGNVDTFLTINFSNL